MAGRLADKVDMQNRLFAELSRMFGAEVPLYDKSLAVNAVCNRAVCDLLGMMHKGFTVSGEQLERTSAERHGAIRIGRADEYRWIGRFFACFAMEPHNFYDMTSVGAKSQPVIATAFRSAVNPGHRVFASLLRTDYFDAETRKRIESLLAQRRVFSDRAKELIARSEAEGGLTPDDADDLIAEGTGRIFKWTGRARDHALYEHLCDAGFKIAADIACFEAHHLNHLTPNTFCIDLYTAAMKFCMEEIDRAAFREQAEEALRWVVAVGDGHFLRLLFRHLTHADIAGFRRRDPPESAVPGLVDRLVSQLHTPDLDLSRLDHAGFKDYTEGPDRDTPVLLRQDAYRALTEPVRFTNPDGPEVETGHTARFGEIEQRFYATTPEGRRLYDECLARAEAVRAERPDLPRADHAAHRSAMAEAFAAFPKTLPELLSRGLVYGRYEPTPEGLARRGAIRTTDLHELCRLGLAARDGLRYEDFLPVSAAGIFASNLSQYGTRSTAPEKPDYTQATLEEILGRPIIDADQAYRGLQADSILDTYARLGLLDELDESTRRRMEEEARACPEPARASADTRAHHAAGA
jgi:uncharacterized glyoxalase superfamily metalloenzyme YdcJ